MTLTNRRDAEEQIDPRVIDALRAMDRDANDAEYEASTPGAGRWRERIGAPRHDHGPTAGEISDDDERPVLRSTTRLAQRHRFGRALDLPPAHNDIDETRWLGWLMLYVAVVIVALIVIWLVMS